MDIRELYQELIIDHGRNPRNHKCLTAADVTADGYNPLCGDKLTVYLKIENNVITDVSFQGSGCAISIASASLMTEIVKGKTKEQALEIFSNLHNLVTKEQQSENLPAKLLVLSGVSAYPSRVKCATLAWHTLSSALSSNSKTVELTTTE